MDYNQDVTLKMNELVVNDSSDEHFHSLVAFDIFL